MAMSCKSPTEAPITVPPHESNWKSRAHGNVSCRPVSRICFKNADRSMIKARKSACVGWRVYVSRLRNVHWSQEVTFQERTKAPLKSAIPILRNKVRSSSDNENSWVHIRKASATSFYKRLSSAPYSSLKPGSAAQRKDQSSCKVNSSQSHWQQGPELLLL